MRRAISCTAGPLAVLAILLSADLAVAQHGGMGGLGAYPPEDQPWTNTTVASRQEVVSAQSVADQRAEDRIFAILRRPYSGNGGDMSLADFVAGISRSTGLPIRLDAKRLEEASIGADSPVRCDLPPVSLRSALDMILDPLSLTWTIQDECLLVTTPDNASNHLVAKVYPVRDLVGPADAMNPQPFNFQPIVQLITETIAPTTWDEVGGSGAITYFSGSGSLVISQTREVHEQIPPLLAALRQARNEQVVGFDATHSRRHGRHRIRPAEPVGLAEPAHYVVVPTGAWSVPQVHE